MFSGMRNLHLRSNTSDSDSSGYESSFILSRPPAKRVKKPHRCSEILVRGNQVLRALLGGA